jgi:Tol biopolymer transport system component
LLVSGRDPETQLSQIWLVSYPDGRATRVTNDLSSYQGLCLTGDGRSIVTVQENRLANIWVADKLGAAPRRLTTETGRDEGLSGIAWSPTGQIVYTTRAAAKQDLWVIEASGANNRQLTFDSGSNFSPAVSPDGRYIVFVSTRAGNADIWRMRFDGTEPVQLTTDPAIEGQPAISSDGKWIVYQVYDRDDRSTIWKVPIDGGEPIRLTEIDSSRPVIAPDGRTIVFQAAPASAGEPATIGSIPLDGGRVEMMDWKPVADARLYRWAADGRSIIYVERRDGTSRLWSYPIGSGPTKQLAEFRDQRIFGFDVSRGGHGVAMSLGSESSEAIMISNFK